MPLAEQPKALTSHYCRLCPADFLQMSNPESSPHMRAVQHAHFAHKVKGLSAACTNDCALRATPDEKRVAHRVYGPGAPKLDPPKVKIEDLIPDGEHS